MLHIRMLSRWKMVFRFCLITRVRTTTNWRLCRIIYRLHCFWLRMFVMWIERLSRSIDIANTMISRGLSVSSMVSGWDDTIHLYTIDFWVSKIIENINTIRVERSVVYSRTLEISFLFHFGRTVSGFVLFYVKLYSFQFLGVHWAYFCN